MKIAISAVSNINFYNPCATAAAAGIHACSGPNEKKIEANNKKKKHCAKNNLKITEIYFLKNRYFNHKKAWSSNSSIAQTLRHILTNVAC